MSLEQFYYVSQIIASTAVLASLIYLALQTRQTARNQRAQMNQARSEWIRESFAKYIDPQFAPVFNAGIAGDPAMDDAQCERFALFATSELMGFEEVMRQWRDGMIDENRWRSTQFNLKRTVTWPGYHAAFELRRAYWDREFVTIVDDALLNVGAFAKPFGQAWKSKVASLRAKRQQSKPAQNLAP